MDDGYLRTVDSEWYRHRLSGVLIVILGAFMILLARLYYLQVIQGTAYRKLSENNSVRLKTVTPPRGLVFDRNENLMVDNRPSFSVSIVKEDAKQPEVVLEKLADFMDEDPETLLEKLETAKLWPSFKPIVLKRDVNRDTVAVLEAHKLDLPGIVITIDPMRHYVENDRAAHLIGYLGEISEEQLQSGRYPYNRRGDLVGKFGVEKSFERYFRGEPGRKQVQVNAVGQVTQVMETVEAMPGENVYLTIDLPLQRKTEELFEGKVGAAVAVDPNNGQILALVSSPAFDPNAFVEGMSFDRWNELISNEFHPMTNKAIQGQYPPGSTYKIVTAIAGLEEGIITKETETYCPGFYRYGNRTYRCWNRRGHGTVKLTAALAQSCDVYFFQVGEKVGVDRLAHYAKACGLGARTNITLDNEATGLVPTTTWKLKKVGIPWQAGETLSVAIGQGFNLVTPLQMAVLTAAVANGGVLYKPTVVKAIRAVDGERVSLEDEIVLGHLPASAKTMDRIRKGLIQVVHDRSGTAFRARVPGITMAGKTGTAQVVALAEDIEEKKEDEIPYKFRDHAWFVAFAPVEKPSIAVSVLVEHGGHGSSAAAPLAQEMIRAYCINDEQKGDPSVSAKPTAPF